MQKNPFDLHGKRALVTGASKGIGLGIARGLANAGANLVLSARNLDELEKARDGVSDETKVGVSSFDLQRTADIAEWFSGIVDEFGPIDILVNNAGMTIRGPTEDLPLDDWNTVLNLNLNSVFALSQAFARDRIQKKEGGKIVNIASLMTFGARPTVAAYVASKGAIGQLTKALAVEWADRDILVNAIAPGFIETPLNEALVNNPEFNAWVKTRTPLGRWGQPEDLGPLAVFLSAEASRYVTGQVIYADGGWTSGF
jgi:gluconate 5-dehydrogenase